MRFHEIKKIWQRKRYEWNGNVKILPTGKKYEEILKYFLTHDK